MSCLDVMYQVYGPPQPYFTAAYTPYHHQKLAFYSKMQESPEALSGSGSFSALSGPIKEEECVRDKDQPPEAEYLSSRCVLFTYFQGDISSVVDEHFSRALSQSSSFSGTHSKTRATAAWRDGSFPMSQRSFPPSFWNSAYQPPGSASLSASHSELPFSGEPFPAGPLQSPEPWLAPHPYSPAFPRPAVHEVYGSFDPRYGSLLVPSVRHRLGAAPGPDRSAPACEISKSEPSGAWSGAFSSADMGLSMDTGLQSQEKSKDLYWF